MADEIETKIKKAASTTTRYRVSLPNVPVKPVEIATEDGELAAAKLALAEWGITSTNSLPQVDKL